MNQKALCIVLATVLIIVSAYLVIEIIEGSEEAEYRSATATDIPILILSDEPSDIEKKISFGTRDVRTDDSFADATGVKAVIIDDAWAKSKKVSEVNKYVSSLLDSGIIVTALYSPDLFLNNPNLNFKAFMESSVTYSVYRTIDGSEYICHSIDDDGTGKALAKTYCWINDQFSVGSSIQMMGDVTLYMIWV